MLEARDLRYARPVEVARRAGQQHIVDLLEEMEKNGAAAGALGAARALVAPGGGDPVIGQVPELQAPGLAPPNVGLGRGRGRVLSAAIAAHLGRKKREE